ncbi:hypothetical protein D917_10068 [Trichinella nativa]|uniref:Uncharacterized protein n=1 Tax=Trichinella nativa TaxID=6335 RepID=A0A1Y3ED19_9BILA|nr:hypothetical protein D917_10068 [Trichinella nativa]
MEREQHHITDLESAKNSIKRFDCADNKLPTICAHFSIYSNWPVGWTCSKILAVPSQPDRGNGNAMRDDDMIVIEALLFQLHPADLLKKHAWLNPHLLVIPR